MNKYGYPEDMPNKMQVLLIMDRLVFGNSFYEVTKKRNKNIYKRKEPEFTEDLRCQR